MGYITPCVSNKNFHHNPSTYSLTHYKNEFHSKYEVFNTDHFKKTMIDFLNSHCDTKRIRSDQMFDYIWKGAEIIEEIISNQSIPKKNCSDEAACSLVWFMTAKMALANELFIDGMCLIPDENGLIADYLRTHLQCYARISTHYRESSIPHQKSQKYGHFGIDIKNRCLPTFKHTILFGQRRDKTTFVKIEKHGCPPFWSRGFRSMSNLMEFIKHVWDYFASRPLVATIKRKLFRNSCNLLKVRSEEINQEIFEQYKKAINNLATPFVSKQEKKSAILEGAKYGYYKMNERLMVFEQRISSDVKGENSSLKKLEEIFDKLFQKDNQVCSIQPNFKPKIARKGHEVVVNLVSTALSHG